MSLWLPAIKELPIIQGADYVVADFIRARDPDTNQRVLLDTTGFPARFTVRERFDTDVVLSCTTGNGYMQTGFDPPKWQANHAYLVGQRVVPTILNGFIYKVTTAGTSHATTPPTWPTTIGATVANGAGALVFTCLATDESVNNLRLYFTHGLTTPLVNWGVGRYDIELEDLTGKVLRTVQGDCWLKQEVSY